MFLKVLACEIAVREICHLAAATPHILDLEFLTQGHHDTPHSGRRDIQERINAVPAGKYDAILLGYALCSNILTGLKATTTRLVVPRAHDCITFFLGSRQRYQEVFNSHPGSYYFSSGWLECRRRRGLTPEQAPGGFLPMNVQTTGQPVYQEWVAKYGEEEARYLMETLGAWTDHYTRGVLIDFDFTKPLQLRKTVEEICTANRWTYAEVQGDLGLLQRMVNGEWDEADFLVVQPGEEIGPTYDDQIIGVKR